MTIVIAIIILLAGLVLPAATQMWRDRKIAEAQNTLTGMLMATRARAIQGGGAETGLFFYVDDQGVQRVATINQNPNDPNKDVGPLQNNDWTTDPRWYNVFTVSRQGGYTMPAPMRVLPTYAVCPESGGIGICIGRSATELFIDVELTNNDFGSAAIGSDVDVAQVHRNFFSIIFSPRGELRVARDVLIRDVDEDFDEEDPAEKRGDVTGLRIGSSGGRAVSNYYSKLDNQSVPFSTDPNAVPIEDLVTIAGVAVNFPSVDGLLVYDDSLFNEAGDPAGKRKYLLESSIPFYISKLTGAVVRGPVGEAPVTP